MTNSDPVHGDWHKSTASGTSNCLEVAFTAQTVLVRDSKDPAGLALTFSRSEWDAFLTGVRQGEFDVG